VHELIDLLLRHPPRPLHLVVISRHDPALALATLRARRQMAEIRIRDLQFSGRESAEFLKHAVGKKLPSSLPSRLRDRTEGWPVGLRLAAIALRGRARPEDLLVDLDEGLVSMQDYLMGEVLNTLPPIEHECVCRTSILDRFCIPLCQALCGNKCGVNCLWERKAAAYPAQSMLLTMALDDQGIWHRYHHLLQQLLRRQLELQVDAAELAELHRRAAAWLEKNGWLDEALKHTLTVPDPEEAARMIIRHRDTILNQEQWPWLDKWLNRLPSRLVNDNPDLLLMKAYILQSRGCWEEYFDAGRRIEKLLQRNPAEGKLTEHRNAGLNVIRGYRGWFGGQGTRAIKYAEQALEHLAGGSSLERGKAMIIMVISHQMIGTLAAGRKRALQYLSNFSPERPTAFQTRIVAALGFADWMSADLPALSREGARLLQLGTQAGLPESILVGRYFLGISSYLRNQLEEAEDRLAAILEGGSAGSFEYYCQSVFALAALYQSRGMPEKARQIAERVLEFGLSTRNENILRSARAFEADLALRQGRIPKAIKWAANYDPGRLLPIYQFYSPHLTFARIQLAQNTEVSRRKARVLLNRLEVWLRKIHNTRFLIDVLSLRARLSQMEGASPAAVKLLAEAVFLARPGDMVRAFTDLGSWIVPLLSLIDLDEEGLRFVGRVLAALQPDTDSTSPDRPGGEKNSLLIESLSPRELEILALMAERLSNKEIGSRLFIAPGTVKRHSENIYQKLAVHSRRDAVAKARGLGILSGR
jgi:LuxR family maltose regulon positive regulatory protein